ncbi:UDP-N-acetylglucosamine 1-carboxyvinyltransferase [Anaeromicropila herbilytica]|uniref:UDP-N-acetylglucosamine 1-carboxyvinyltransferase n=1 Tax=Anaeromicropila herbilytica TaxID=2785025 RepID=A0A7R7IE25_9FIRM|nr:UDP-N-acetylglucosamine 1-carboxyvinyltransferase [Anaeromicropila herbilytica]BCN31551.1 UDP-N-acetylglucosamine 1-carboxyvinyltransferase [Anaeromicropila herbilytica]
MSTIEIIGGKHLYGEVSIQGSKNAVLPILAASLLNKGVTKLNNCPKILDVINMIKILEHLGALIIWDLDSLIIDTSNLTTTVVPEQYVKEMRSSIIVLGSLLARQKEVTITYPGGCSIGARPIDLHLSALKQLGVEVLEEDDNLICKAEKIVGTEITLEFPSVGATENTLLAAVLAEGVTTIKNAAKEPEIVELCCFLNSLGAKITGIGKDEIIVQGVEKLHDTTYTLIADRIVAGTYLAAVQGAGGKVTLRDIDDSQLGAILSILRTTGSRITSGNDFIQIKANRRPKAADIIRTKPYPYFPTDMQSQMLSVLSLAKGTSIMIENIFEARYKTVHELIKMGADITVEGKVAIIKGVKKLYGANVNASDLRGGAGLVIAGLMAEGLTVVNNPIYIERGYEDICRDLAILSADVKKV